MKNRARWSRALAMGVIFSAAAGAQDAPTPQRRLEITGVYGGVPTELLDRGKTLADFGINAVWVGSGGLSRERVELLKRQGAKVFAEFNTLHDAAYPKQHPDAAPIGADGRPSDPPDGWQGVCPTHPAYRKSRMEAFRKTLADFAIDGIWLDYHHSHASWEQAVPNMPDTCFCARCLARFEADTGIDLPEKSTTELAGILLGPKNADWVKWRCGIFTDWIKEFRNIRNEVRPKALLGTFHCPWNETDFDGALRKKLAIDLKAQAEYIDVFSIMPYHARFGHVDDPAWISRQAAWLGKHLGVEGKAGERIKIWPIVQLSDWGERVRPEQVLEVLDHGTRLPATGVTVFVWGSLVKDGDKVDRMGRAFRSYRP